MGGDTFKPTRAQRLAFVGGVTVEAVERTLTGYGRLDVDVVERSVGLPRGSLGRFLSGDLDTVPVKPGPNEVTRAQLAQLPGLHEDRIDRVLSGGPYFTLEEFAVVAEVSKAVVAEFIATPHYRRVDKTTARGQALTPEPGMYISELPSAFEDAEPERHGFEIKASVTLGDRRVAVFAPSDFNAAVTGADQLKRAVTGRVIPAVRDADGLLRYFAPRRIDVWFETDTPPQRARAILAELGLTLRAEASDKLAAVGFYPSEMPEWPKGDPFAAMLDLMEHGSEFRLERSASGKGGILRADCS
jgi:hypothetical protein